MAYHMILHREVESNKIIDTSFTTHSAIVEVRRETGLWSLVGYIRLQSSQLREGNLRQSQVV